MTALAAGGVRRSAAERGGGGTDITRSLRCHLHKLQLRLRLRSYQTAHTEDSLATMCEQSCKIIIQRREIYHQQQYVIPYSE